MCDIARLAITLVLGVFVLYGPIWPTSTVPAYRDALPSRATPSYRVVPPTPGVVATQPDTASQLDRATSGALPLDPFAEVLRDHEAALPQLAAWRRTFAAHAGALTDLVTSLPGAQHLDRDIVYDRLRSRGGFDSQLDPDVFAPWANAWVGTWSDGSPQYHRWDETRRWGTHHVQLVAQSEVALPDANGLGALLVRDEVDLAINVVSEEAGITGWVAKRQHGRLALPCLGYLLDRTLLLWLCHASAPGAPLFDGDSWFAYLEGVDATTLPPVYHIQGQPFEIGATVTWDPAEQAHHHGRYTAYSNAPPAWTAALP
ncbi:MAG: hypothetical protein AAGN64_01440 [Bacteroidota bacterium]